MTTVVQQANSVATTGTSTSVTLASAPTAGNLLIAIVASQGTSGVTNAPWGATVEQNAVAGGTSNARFYSKVVAVGESATISATFPVSGTVQIWVIEIAPKPGSAWDATRLDQSAGTIDPGSNITTISSGITPTLTTADQFALTAVPLNGLSGGSVTTTNGYTLALTGSRVLIAYNTLASSAATSTTFSWTTARRAGSALQTYKQTAGGTTSTGSAVGSRTWTGSASGTRASSGSATGSRAWTGTAAGTHVSRGSAAGATAHTGSASGIRSSTGTAGGTRAWIGAAAGVMPATPPGTGSATGSRAYVGTAAGGRTSTGAAAGVRAYVGTTAGQRVSSGTATGTHLYVGAALGHLDAIGTATGQTVWVGTSAGAAPQFRDVSLTATRLPDSRLTATRLDNLLTAERLT